MTFISIKKRLLTPFSFGTPQTLYNTVQNPLQRFAQPGDRTLYLSQQAAVVLNKAGQVVTSFTSNQFYPKYTNLINQITGGK